MLIFALLHWQLVAKAETDWHVSFMNRHTAAWEPLIEPVKSEITVCICTLVILLSYFIEIQMFFFLCHV